MGLLVQKYSSVRDTGSDILWEAGRHVTHIMPFRSSTFVLQLFQEKLVMKEFVNKTFWKSSVESVNVLVEEATCILVSCIFNLKLPFFRLVFS